MASTWAWTFSKYGSLRVVRLLTRQLRTLQVNVLVNKAEAALPLMASPQKSQVSFLPILLVSTIKVCPDSKQRVHQP